MLVLPFHVWFSRISNKIYLESLRHIRSSCTISFAVPFNFIRFLIIALCHRFCPSPMKFYLIHPQCTVLLIAWIKYCRSHGLNFWSKPHSSCRKSRNMASNPSPHANPKNRDSQNLGSLIYDTEVYGIYRSLKIHGSKKPPSRFSSPATSWNAA